MPELSVVIPTYNEKENISILIERIATALSGIDYLVIVVDDQSPDGTGTVVQDLIAAGNPIKLITKDKKEGIGAALRVGYQAAQTPIIASMDADLSFDARDLRRLYEAVRGGRDLVVGTRHSKGSFYETPNRTIRNKYWTSRLGNRMLRLVSRIPIDDFTGNMRVFTRAAWDRIKTTENTNFLLFEMILKAHRRGCSIGQIPVAFHDRRFGTSKLRLSWEAPKFLVILLKHLWGD